MSFYQKHRKTIKRLISTFVPVRSWRHKITSALDYPEGWRVFLKQARQMKRIDKSHPQQKYFLSVLAIIKNESAYLPEWLEYYSLLGVDKIYIYDNESDDGTMEILKPYIDSGFVEYKYWPGQKQQLPAYRHCIETHKFDTTWLAVVDLDEFILPIKHGNIADYLRSLPKSVGQVAMPWLFFGSNGHVEKPSGLVIESYTKSARKIWQRKSIINPRLIFDAFVHVGVCASKTIYPNKNVIRTNHYYCKSWTEYQRRKSRGDALHGKTFAENTFQRADFDKHDTNDIDDTAILKHVPELNKKLRK